MEPLSLDEAFLDVTGSQHLSDYPSQTLPEPTDITQELWQAGDAPSWPARDALLYSKNERPFALVPLLANAP